MAYTKKNQTASVKATEVKATEVESQEVVVNETEGVTSDQVGKDTVVDVVAPVKNNVKYRKEIDLKMMVSCRNITSGSLIYVSKKTGFEANWDKLDDEEYIEVSELLTMKSSQPRFLQEPWIMVDDDEVVDYLGLREMYDNIILKDELEVFFRLSPTEIEAKLRIAPKGTRTLVAEQARAMVENDKLYDTRVIRTIEKELQIDLSMITN
jgi:hypothetical protein